MIFGRTRRCGVAQLSSLGIPRAQALAGGFAVLLLTGAAQADNRQEDSIDVSIIAAGPAPATSILILEPGPAALQIPSEIQAPSIVPLSLDSVMAPADPGQLLSYLKEDYYVPDTALPLAEAIALALANNHDLNSRRLQAAAAVQDIKVNWTALQPQLSAQGKAYWQYSNVRPAQGDQETGLIENLALSITQRLYDFGLTSDLVDLAEARHAIEHFAVSTAEQQLVSDVTAAYLDYNLALGQSRIRHDELRLAEEILRQARIQFEVGTAPRLDVIRAEARVEAAQGGVIASSTAVGNAAARFFSLLGVENQRYVPELVSEDYLQLGIPGDDLAATVNAALQHRPELMLLSSTLLAGQEQRKLAKNRPIIEAFGNWQYTNPQPGSQGTYGTNWGLQINWPVFTGGKDRIDRKKADLTIASIAESILGLEAQVELDAIAAWNRLYAARSQAGVARKNLELSAETLRSAFVGYQAGVTPYLDFADALDRNVAAAIGYLTALAEVRLANVNLQRAAGFPDGYPQDSRAGFDPSTPVETILGLPGQDATAALPAQ